MRPRHAAKRRRCKTYVAKVVIISVAHFWSSRNEIRYVMLFQHLLQHLCHTVLLQRSGTSHGVTGALSVRRVNAVYLKSRGSAISATDSWRSRFRRPVIKYDLSNLHHNRHKDDVKHEIWQCREHGRFVLPILPVSRHAHRHRRVAHHPQVAPSKTISFLVHDPHGSKQVELGRYLQFLKDTHHAQHMVCITTRAGNVPVAIEVSFKQYRRTTDLQRVGKPNIVINEKVVD